ncbi:MAG: DUF748 domain-containing protein [Gammaproteobacteria bacterium]|nr:DUF748 domain-containing protein [Gammaproteobacteria bacterium]MBU1506722.1 DUF748 domain-containing protein [Gammaproteobacteria bacterium]MBU2120602.1 DUF748 domain-containing protein [Gammaproteobacteria bacterium]MBU2201107.1 DUF748 domain-containing protein [Gammaproteobacteria bacterium]MBU2275278.1 DUF748 domain-containing protein [Gammaproteobacteria bacterium]
MPLTLRSASLASVRQHRWFRPAMRVLAGVVMVWLVTWLAVPPLAKGPLQRLASEQLGRAVTIGAIDFRPWSLEFALRDVAVAGAEGAPPQLTIGRIYADGELQSLLRWAPVVDAFRIENPALRITHLGGGHYDVDDILEKVTAPTGQSDRGPARLALYNLTLQGGSVDFVDPSVGNTHEVRALAFTVPFISTLPSQREVKVEPRLAFTLDGSRFDSSAQGTPFAQTGKADAQIRLDGLDLAPYLAYLPANLPAKVQGATLDVDVKLAFEQHPRMAVKLTGSVTASNVRITDRQGADLLSYERLKIDMADVRPLEQVVRLQHVELTAPVLTAQRDAAGRINLAQLVAHTAPASTVSAANPASTASAAPSAEPAAPAAAASAASTPAASPSSTAASAPTQPTPPTAPPTATQRKPAAAAPAWVVEIASAALRGGMLRWADQTTRPAATLQATDFTLDVADVALPFAQEAARPVTFKGGMQLQGSTLSFAGEATDRKAQAQATLNALALQLAAPYLAQVLEPTVAGQLTGDIGLQWAAPTPEAARAGATGVTLTAGPLALEQLAVKQGKTTLAGLGKLELAGATVALDTRTATLERLSLSQPQLSVERGADGRWMFERWIKAPAATLAPSALQQAEVPTPAAAAEAKPAAASAAPWKLRVADFSLQGGAVSLADNAQPRPVALELSALGITARNLASDGSKPEAFQLTARAAAPAKGNNKATPGKIDYQGTLALQPWATEGKLDATRLPLHTLDGYLASQLAVELLHADVGYRGQVAVSQTDQGVSLRMAGDAIVEELQANSTAASTPKTEAQVGEELLAWKSLSLRGLAVATAPGTAPRVEIKETSLVDFFARITVNEAGRINLSDIAKTPAEAQAANAASPNANTAPNTRAAAASAPAATAAPAAVAQANPLAPVVVFGPVSLVNGKVLFSDFFIKPNYSADLSELTGKLSAFSSEAPGGEPVLADLELRGRAEGSASLEVTGKLNPLAKPLALDIVGKVRDLELPPLTPYAVKYAGHGIERGKLSVDVNYKVLPNGQLTASNRLVLNQLTFGEPVEGAPNSLPVKLAVALLADRQGVIDLDLPISGSLNDPQFRLGPVIGRIIVNLIGKALTSPFSLLASAFGGGEEMNQVPFAPGSATLTPEAQQSLDKIAKALVDRPALKITVTGMASLQAEREGLQREGLQQRLLAEKRRTNPADTSPVSAAEYPALLKEVYGRAEIPKPRNLVGLAKELTVPEMEALLLANQAATDAMATELATQRGQAIRTYLVAQKLPVERLFVAAPKAGKQAEKWTPRADLSLGTQ